MKKSINLLWGPGELNNKAAGEANKNIYGDTDPKPSRNYYCRV